MWGPPAPSGSLEERIAPLFSPPFFPVHLRNVPSQPEFHETPSEPWRIGSAVVSAALVKHPGPAVGYRIDEGGRTLAYLPDHEPGLGAASGRSSPSISGLALARRADLLLHDGQYTQAEYDDRVGWGHSSTADAVTFAERAGARRIVLFHHDPMHTDDQLEAMLADTQQMPAAASIGVELAHEGQTFVLA